ncbi:MAG TPA: hypothetical protein VF596_19960 [Pyrinomonadaceae bacterium]|jgi:hypothetical protein
MPNPILGFVTDGRFEQVLGIATLLNYLNSTSIYDWVKQVWIVTGYNKINDVENLLRRLFDNFDFHFVIGEIHNDDKYYIQVGLSNFFRQLPKHQNLFCIDYDHLILNPVFSALDSPEKGVMVSSEFYETIITESILQKGKVELPDKHFNASLILGSANNLCKIGALWDDAYEYLRPIAPQRNRVEIAFALAAKRADVVLIPCNKSIQSNFALPSLDSYLFHYGGDSKEAKLMKNKLSELANNYPESTINADILNQIHEELVTTLKSLIIQN